MKSKNRCFCVLLIILALLLSGCDLWNQLYGQQPKKEEGVTLIPIEDINIKEEQKEAGEEPKELFPPKKEEKVEEKKEVTGEKAEEIVREEGAIVIIAQETELISLVPNASDPDNDKLQFFYTQPLNDKGEWKTTYGDEGEYTVTITASDGLLSTSQNVLIIVNKKEEAPTIDKSVPAEKLVETQENTTIEFSIEASDLNKDKLAYIWKLDGNEVSTSKTFSYKISFNDAGTHKVTVDVSDNTKTTSQVWDVKVANLNRVPVLEDIKNIVVKETETVTIKPKATDPDGDKITFTISEPVGNSGVWKTSYDDAGKYTVKVTASDGTDSVTKDVIVEVQNVNRPPVITNIVRK